jgi:hypothetical protein
MEVIKMFSWRKRNIVHTGVPDGSPLREVLESKYCNHCKKHCKLSAPMCKRGKKEAEIVANDFSK